MASIKTLAVGGTINTNTTKNIVHHSSMGCVLQYMSMFSGFNQTNMREIKEEQYLYTCLNKFLLISKYGYKTI